MLQHEWANSGDSNDPQCDDSWIGVTVSQGTMLLEDLIPAVMRVIDEVWTTKADFLWTEYPDVALALDEGRDFDDDALQESACWMWEDVYEAMHEIAPTGCCWGSHEGDGAAFGFWTTNPDGVAPDDPDAGDLVPALDAMAHDDVDWADYDAYDRVWLRAATSRPTLDATAIVATAIAIVAGHAVA